MMFEKMTIIQILPEMEEGGVEGETFDQAVYLARQGHNSIVISGGGRLLEKLEREGCRHILCPGIGEKNFRCLKYIERLRQIFISEKPDIIHLRSRLPAWVGYLAWKMLPAHDRPSLVTTFHGFYSVNRYSEIMTKGQRVVAVSNTIRDHIIENYGTPGEKITLIYGGFDTETFDPDKVSEARVEALRQRWGLQDRSEPVIILPGRLTKWKGQEDFIESLAMIRDLPFIALCVGEIDEKQKYTKKIRDKITHYNLQDKVKLVGHCDDMPAAMLAGHLIVSASSTQPEAFGKVAIEAMSMGRPVIATAHGGSLETVVDNVTGWLVEPQRPAAMAKAIAKALGDEKTCNTFGQAGRKWVHEHFTAEVMCRKNLALYKQMLQEKKKKMRKENLTVLQMVPELEGGGVERGTLELGKFLVQQGHRSFVVSGGGRLVNQLEDEGSSHVFMKVGVKSPNCLKYIFPLRQLMLRESVDILHLRSRLPAWIGYLAWKSIPKKKRPLLVTTFHGFYSINAYSAIMTKGEVVIAVSESIQKHIAEHYSKKENVVSIFRGVDTDVFNPESVNLDRLNSLRKEWGIDPGKPVIMLPGRMTRLKGQDVFLMSLASLQNRNFQAVLVGDTPESTAYKNEIENILKQYNLTDSVKLVGHCNDMAAALLLSDIVVSATSSTPEAFGRIAIEAMAMGKPVIATAHGGSLEIVVDKETGWLVEPSNFLAMSKALDEALDMPKEKLDDIGENGRNRVLSKFTTKTMCEQTVETYKRYLRERSLENGYAQEAVSVSAASHKSS
jgi:glycosyltransferase involved in cell wall biosynthesis